MGELGEWMMKGPEKSLPLLAANSSRMAKMWPGYGEGGLEW